MSCKQKSGLSNKGVNLFQDDTTKHWEITEGYWVINGE